MIARRRYLAAWVAALISTTVARAATITVDLAGGGDFTEIQPALDAAADGDTVLVKPGEYVISQTIVVPPRLVTLKAERGSLQTTIRMAPPPEARGVLAFAWRSTPGQVVEGFTITGGTGGAASTADGAGDATILGCRITGNSVADEHGSIFGAAAHSSIVVDRCSVTGNLGTVFGMTCGGAGVIRSTISINDGPIAEFDEYGGGVSFTDCDISGNRGGIWAWDVDLVRCRFVDNAGGIGGSSVQAWDCAFVGNGGRVQAGADDGGWLELTNCVVARSRGVGVVEGTIRLDHCSILASTEAAVFGGSSTGLQCTELRIDSSILWGNAALWALDGPEWPPGDPYAAFASVSVTYSCLQEPFTGIGNIAIDPLFCTDTDPESCALSSGSPCLGTGRDGSDMGAHTGTCTELILDDGGPGTSSTQTWWTSGGSKPYGTKSVYSNLPGAEYRYALLVPAPGEYELSLWWTTWPSRLRAVPVEVRHAGGTSTVTIDQQLNPGRWNVVGRWRFDGIGQVRILSLGGGSTCADAVKLAPAAMSEVILDNGQAGTSSTGWWNVSGGPNPYGANSLYSKQAGATYRFAPALPNPGPYRVWMWWTEYPSRPAKVRVDIQHRDGTSTVYVNQLADGGRWNDLGVWAFDATATITIFSGGVGSTCADAVRLTPEGAAPPPPPWEKVIDDGQPGTSWTGYWPISGAVNPYGIASRYSKTAGATYAYTFQVPAASDYEFYLWWTTYPSRPSRVRVDLALGGGVTRTVYVDQTIRGSRWNSLGKYPVTSSATVTIVSGGVGSTCADAAKAARRYGGETPPRLEPIGYWRFDDGSGNVANDSADGHVGQVFGAVWEPGHSGTALRFDGVDDYVAIPGIFSFTALTFAAWVKTDSESTNNRRIITLHDGIDPRYYHFDLEANSGSGLQVYAGTATVVDYDWTFRVGTWTHVAVTYARDVGRIYWNGALIHTGSLPVGPRSGRIFIGGVDRPNWDALPWAGAIDDVVVFDRALSADEVRSLHEGGVR